MKKWLLILVAIFGFASIGSAQKIDVGFHMSQGLHQRIPQGVDTLGEFALDQRFT